MNIKLYLFGATMLCSSLFSFHQVQKTILDKHSEFYVGPQGYYTTMAMEGLPPDFQGDLWGVVVGYQLTLPKSLYFLTQANWAIGQMNSSNKPSRCFHDYNIEFDFGYVGRFGKYQIIPFIGYAFQYLIEHRYGNSQYVTTQFDYLIYNFPIGFRFDYLFNENFQLGLKVQGMININPMVKISQLAGSFWALKTRYGVKAELPFECSVGKNVTSTFQFTPFFHWYQLGPSTAVTEYGLPLNVYQQTIANYGAYATLGWKF